MRDRKDNNFAHPLLESTARKDPNEYWNIIFSS